MLFKKGQDYHQIKVKSIYSSKNTFILFSEKSLSQLKMCQYK